MSGGTADLDAAFAHCTRLARRTGRNFYWSFLTLPREMRRDMAALYAFMRVTDDLGDDPAEPLDRRRAAVANWRDRTAAALAGGSVDADKPHAVVLRAFADVARRRGIPAALPGDVVDGVAADLAGPPAVPGVPRVFFETDAGLDAYCYQVAGAVGLCCLYVWGCDGLGEGAREPALACGRAFQRTNVLRDLAEDAAAGRCYLPADTLARFGVGPADFLPTADLSADRDGEPVVRRIARLLRCEVDRTRAEYAAAEPLFDSVSPAGRGVLRAMTAIYGGLLDRVEAAGIGVLDRRVRVPAWRKAAAVAAGLADRFARSPPAGVGSVVSDASGK